MTAKPQFKHDPTVVPDGWVRPIFSATPLDIARLPPHPDLPTSTTNTKGSLADFLNVVLKEVAETDFDSGWKVHKQEWQPSEPPVHLPEFPGRSVSTPNSQSNVENRSTKSASISVVQQTKNINQKKWLARTSYHSPSEIEYSELDSLLSQNHSRNEGLYTPSVFDVNELLTWGSGDLEGVVGELDPSFNVQRVQMSIFQMFHEMPEVGGLHLLHDRVFHTLVITIHSTYTTSPSFKGSKITDVPQSHTIQLPLHFDTFEDIPVLKERTHVKKQASSWQYHWPSAPSAVQPTPAQQKRIGKKLVEGKYVSLERLRRAPIDVISESETAVESLPHESGRHHRWDMMTLSSAEGSTRLAPEFIKNREILDAVSEDVYFVVKMIAEGRRAGGESGAANGVGN